MWSLDPVVVKPSLLRVFATFRAKVVASSSIYMSHIRSQVLLIHGLPPINKDESDIMQESTHIAEDTDHIHNTGIYKIWKWADDWPL